jgi:transcriptional regulator with XRE-family HTH domain
VLQRWLRTASRRGLLLHSELNRDKRTEGSAEIAMGTRVPDPIDRYVGSRVRMRRLMLDMSQEKLGNELGITFQQVQKYEKGTNRVSASRLQEMSYILQVPVLSDRGMDCTADPRINAAPVSVRLRAGCWRKTPYLAALARRRARPRPPSQRWRTFLSNHRADIAAQPHSRSQETLPRCQKFPHHFRSTVPRVNPLAPNPRARARGRGADDGAGGAARARRWCATAPRFNNCVEGAR